MLYSQLGHTGLTVSRFSLGAMTFTAGAKPVPSISRVDPGLADRLVGQACNAGINFFDTADIYNRGESEIVLGKALAARRKDVIIATKVGARTGRALPRAGLSRRHILMSIDESLERLGTDWVDVYVAHVFDPFTPLDETLEALDAVVHAGKVRYLGFSNWPAWAIAQALERQRANGWAPFTHGQMFYSLLGRDVERDIIPVMAQYGLGLTAWSPLAFGFLSGKFTRETLGAQGTRFAETDIMSFEPETGFVLLDLMRELATARDCSMAQIALAWLIAKAGVTSILLGVTGTDQLDDNLGAMAIDLSPDELASLDAATAITSTYPNSMIERFFDPKLRQALTAKSGAGRVS